VTTPYRVLVTGSRDWDRPEIIRLAIDYALCEAARVGRHLVVVHGACPRGADDQAATYVNRLIACDMPVRTEPHPANWQINGKRAGFIRNAHMVNLGADLCLAFIRNGSRGASHTADLAEKAGIPTRRWTA
jgi:hypothetical protein